MLEWVADDNDDGVKTTFYDFSDLINILKTSILRDYLVHLIRNPHSLIVKIFGLFRLNGPGPPIVLTVMQSVGSVRQLLLKWLSYCANLHRLWLNIVKRCSSQTIGYPRDTTSRAVWQEGQIWSQLKTIALTSNESTDEGFSGMRLQKCQNHPHCRFSRLSLIWNIQKHVFSLPCFQNPLQHSYDFQLFPINPKIFASSQLFAGPKLPERKTEIGRRFQMVHRPGFSDIRETLLVPIWFKTGVQRCRLSEKARGSWLQVGKYWSKKH